MIVFDETEKSGLARTEATRSRDGRLTVSLIRVQADPELGDCRTEEEAYLNFDREGTERLAALLSCRSDRLPGMIARRFACPSAWARLRRFCDRNGIRYDCGVLSD